MLSRLRERNAKQLEPYKKFELAIERVPIKIPNFNPRNCSNSFTVFNDYNYTATLSMKSADD